ncbi:MAG: hypothetical protein AAF849_15730 [Bacteroidota bacterium]
MHFQTPIVAILLSWLLFACGPEKRGTVEDKINTSVDSSYVSSNQNASNNDDKKQEEQTTEPASDRSETTGLPIVSDKNKPTDKETPNDDRQENDSKKSTTNKGKDNNSTTSSNTKSPDRVNILSPNSADSEDLSDAAISSLMSNLSMDSITKAVTARVIESFPDTMRLNERELLSIVLTSDTTKAFLNEIIAREPVLKKYPDRVESFIVSEVGKIMASRLIDADDAFEIEPLFSKKERFIDLLGGKPQRWEWYVKPIKEGVHQLSYVIERIEVIGGNQLGSSSVTPVVEKDVTVIVQPTAVLSSPTPDLPKNTSEGAGKISSWIHFLLVGLLLLALVVFVLLRSKKKDTTTIASIPSKRITELIAGGKTEQAIDLLEASSSQLSHAKRKEITMLSSRWSSVESEMNKGTISSQDADIKRNRIHDRLLDLIHELSR